MKSFTLFFTLALFFISPVAISQSIKGKVFEKKSNQKNYLPGVNIYWLGTTNGTISDLSGTFELNAPHLPASLVISFVGYKTDTILINEFKAYELELKNTIELSAITIEAKEQTTKISTLSNINIETITSKELLKAACCNLSESFETNASVDVSFKDGVSGTKQIQMLGLDGAYTQILAENIPAIRGLSSGFGLNFIPGTWVESIQITKGAGSVVNGYESTTGQINVELQKPENSDRLFFNAYANHAGRYEANLHLAQKINEKWSGLLLSHASTSIKKNDFNKDGFVDMPLMNQYNFINRWKYNTPGKFMAQFGIKALVDERNAGQVAYQKPEDNLAKKFYGIGIDSKQLEFFSKTAKGFKNPFTSLGLISNFKHFQQQSFYGLKNYAGEQNTAYFNLIYQSFILTTDHQYKAGLSYTADHYEESYNDSSFSRKESIPGLFAEYTYEIDRKFSFVGGIRADKHNLFGNIITPRSHLKFHPSEAITIRLSVGKGQRVANVFIDNSALLASSREIKLIETLQPEIAWNYGASYTHKLSLFDKEAVFNSDYYYTNFENQVIADFDQAVNSVSIYNLNGKSFSHSFQTELSIEPLENFTVKSTYKWYNVKKTYDGILLQVPFQASNRAMLNLSYATKFEKWKMDFTSKWFDKSRIPSTAQNSLENQLDTWSVSYLTFNAQITRMFKHFEVYLGAENIGNFMQEHAIIAASEPFSPQFDASLIWGPVMGRIIYSGLRFSIK